MKHDRHIYDLGIKELRSLARDPLMIVLIVVSFTLSIYSGAKGLPETLNQAPIAVVDEDRSPLSARIIGALYPPHFLPPILITHAEMDARMDAGLDTFALSIPPDFQRDVLAGHAPSIQLNVDATRMSQAFNGAGYLQGIVSQEVLAFTQRYRANPVPAVELAARVRFNPELNRSWFGAVMELVSQITLLSIVLTGTALIRERERGTVEHLLVMPITPFEIMAAKVWSMGLVVLVASALSLTFVVQGLLAVPVEGSVPLFLAAAAVFMFATTSLGIFMGTFARSMPQFGLLLMLVLLPLNLLSGAATPRESMPAAVQNLMLLAPTTHFVGISQGILYRGADIAIVWPQFLALAVIGAACFGIALARFRRTLGTLA